jgi:hypothetical protein
VYRRETSLLDFRLFKNRVLRILSGPKVEEMTRGLKNCIMSSLNILDKKVKKDEMGGARDTHGRDEKCIQNFGRKS